MRYLLTRSAGRRFLLCLLACLGLACEADDPNTVERDGGPAGGGGSEEITILKHSLLPEASGLAVSRRTDQRFWFINDSGNAAELIALEMPARRFRVAAVLDVQNEDWEELEGFSLDGEPWLVIADVGDNRASRDVVRMHLLPEPDPASDVVHVHTTINLTYPGGPRDAEAVAVDPVTRIVYVLSKRETPPRLFSVELPSLERVGTHDRVLQELGPVNSIPRPTAHELAAHPKLGRYRAQPTAMSLAPDGSFIALLTYRGVYRAALGDDRDWLSALNDSLCAVASVDLEQAESIAVDRQNRIVVTTEGREAPLLRFDPSCSPTLY